MDECQIFKALSDPTRLRCLSLLNGVDELCVCELTHALSLPQPKISHHLAALRKVGLVTDRKDGLWIFYRINPNIPKWIINVLNTTIKGLHDTAPYTADLSALSQMQKNPANICNG